MSFATLFILSLLLVGVVWLLVMSLRRQSQASIPGRLFESIESLKAELVAKQLEGLVALRQTLDETNRTINERLAQGNSSVDRRLEIIGEIEHKLGQLQQQTENIEQIGNNIQSLSDLLKPPKMRGVLGEMLLENLLASILPQKLFSMQYNLTSGCRVDAVVRLGNKLLPIDSKFPLESYQRLVTNHEPDIAQKQFRQALKKQIDSIHDKYLLPEQGTTEFAVMYIPSEAVYYQMVAGEDQELFDYALRVRVIPSSPGHLYAFLASLAAMQTGTELAGDTARLSAAVTSLSESLSRLTKLHDRIEGSSRSLSLSLSKARDELGDMTHQLDRLQRPAEREDESTSTVGTE
ncbi:MAG: DNA recombination protein RmuC [candidate division Zixibacteria bacterium]|nr:DNA recombination protein RmuC [candidate division Zixibacteria bacterium]